MLLLHRLTPFVIVLAMAAGAGLLRNSSVHPFVVAGGALLVVSLLFARLLEWRVGTLRFWAFLVVPLGLGTAAFALMLFLEQVSQIWILGILTALLAFFFAEHLFAYLHMPGRYRMNALEYVALVIHVFTIFGLAASLYALRLFTQVSLWIAVPTFALSVFILLLATLWICKIEGLRLRQYACAGTLVMTELFFCIAQLPTGFYPNAALLAVASYLLLGTLRAHTLHKLSKPVALRYVMIGIVLIGLIVGTARWV